MTHTPIVLGILVWAMVSDNAFSILLNRRVVAY
jgi:hypothetical protein